MKIAGLHIDRFGARRGLDLAGITDQLNIVYGPNGAGKTTIIQFLRWMLFGQRDEISRRYLTTSSGEPASGSMKIADGTGTRSLQRTSQTGSNLSQLTFDGSDQPATSPAIGVSNSEFDRHFVLGFDQPRNIADLLNSARAHGIQLHIDERKIARIRQITEQRDSYRDELSLISVPPIELLRDRREQKLRELEESRIEQQRRREELERQRAHTANDLSEQQTLASRLAGVVENIENAIENRKRQLTNEYSQWQEARRDREERRQRRLAEIDAQLSRWQEILAEVRSRIERNRSRIDGLEQAETIACDSSDVQFFMRRLGFRIRDVEQDISGVYDSDSWRDHQADADYLRGLLGSALNVMQTDLNRLCQVVESQQNTNQYLEVEQEYAGLRRVESELSHLVETLTRQRSQLVNRVELSPYQYDVVTGSVVNGAVVGLEPEHTTTIEIPEMLADFRLRHLMERRDASIARRDSANLEVTNIQTRLRSIEAELERFVRDAGAPGMEGRLLEQDIAEIDEQLQLHDRRAWLERTIAPLEAELRRVREQTGSSVIVDNASTLLQQLTSQDYSRIYVTSDHQCKIGRSSQVQQPSAAQDWHQLSRGVQDQAYLALSLAIADAYRQRGAIVPLILNDVFSNLDADGSRALVNVLRNLASNGQQILVFTRHDHIRELFGPTGAKVFTLDDLDSRPLTHTQPVVAPVTRAPVPVQPLPPIEPVRIPIKTVTTAVAPVMPRAEQSPEPRDPTYRWVAEWQRKDPVHNIPAPHQEPPIHVEPPAPLESPAESPEDEPPIATLKLEDALSDSSILTEELVGYLEEIEILTVGQLIERDPEEVAEALVEYGITDEMIQRRQRELLMLVYLGVSVLDAQMLVACGVPDPDRLSRADEGVLLKRIETLFERPQTADRFGRFADYSLNRIRRWIELADRSGYRSQTRRTYTKDSGKSSSTRSGKTTRTRKRSRSSSAAPTVRMKSDPTLRFYLELNDPVVDAPSIGAKTAEKLNECDIYTVTHLIEADAEELAAKLDDRRFSAETVEQWQLQSQLVCRIPNLRGHDAQILVACGVDDPVTLSSMDASTFLKKVLKFVRTKDGQRVIRNGKKPDLAEVTAWIEWSESARQLRAA